MSLSKEYFSITKRKYFYNIMPIANIKSVMQRGIISFHEAKGISNHVSVAMNEVQQRREGIVIAGHSLHDYANLYFSARNPMMYKRKDYAEELCILGVSTEILDNYSCIISDRNAASPYAKFFDAELGINTLNYEMIFADSWIHDDDPYKTDLHKKIKCAEVLVLNHISPMYICGAYVVDELTKSILEKEEFGKPIIVTSKMFFGEGE